MKFRVRAAWFILAVMLLLTLSGRWWVHVSISQTLNDLNTLRAQAQAGNFTAANQSAQLLASNFDQRSHSLELFIKRENVSAIAVSLHGLAAYTNADNVWDLHSEINKVQTQLRLTEHIFCTLF